VFKSAGYNVFYFVFGLIQLMIFVLSVLLADKNLDLCSAIRVSAGKIIGDGAVLFFCTACICSSALDYYFTPREVLDYKRPIEGLVFTCIPALMFIFVTVLYCGAFFINKDVINYGAMKIGTIICFIFTILYSLIFRSTQFSKWLN